MSKSKLEFNVAGPCIPGKHYMLDPLRGIDEELMALIDGEKYFVMHAARQTGKTTLLRELVRRVNATGDYYAMYCTLEAAEAFTNPIDGIPAIVSALTDVVKIQGLPEGFGKNAADSHASNMMQAAFGEYCRSLDKPLVVFFDEADSLSDDTLITFLRQLRSGYVTRDMAPFIHSAALVGMRNIRDFKVKVRPDSGTLGRSSPFNIITESFNLRNFIKEEVVELYAQHTAETGQVFEQEMIDYTFDQTQGQPWLVNAIARECVEKITKKDYTIPITQGHAEQAIQNIVRNRMTHVDSLLDKLKDTRVRNILVPIIHGEDVENRSTDDFLFTRDLGLIREAPDGRVEPANPIYADLITRALNWDIQESIKRKYDYTIPRYLKDGKLDMDFLIRDFQEFWRENSEIWKKCLDKELYIYEEAAPHLVIMAFLQRVINGGGTVIREKALGTKRVDLCIEYQEQKYPVELKILQNERKRIDSLTQAVDYANKLGADTAWLVIFDTCADKTWDEKIYLKEETINGKRVVVAGC